MYGLAFRLLCSAVEFIKLGWLPSKWVGVLSLCMWICSYIWWLVQWKVETVGSSTYWSLDRTVCWETIRIWIWQRHLWTIWSSVPDWDLDELANNSSYSQRHIERAKWSTWSMFNFCEVMMLTWLVGRYMIYQMIYLISSMPTYGEYQGVPWFRVDRMSWMEWNECGMDTICLCDRMIVALCQTGGSAYDGVSANNKHETDDWKKISF